MDAYQLGKEIQRILSRLDSIESRLNQSGDGGINKDVSDGPPEFVPGSLVVTVGNVSGFSDGGGGRSVPFKNETGDRITMARPGGIDARPLDDGSTLQCMLLETAPEFTVSYQTRFWRVITGRIADAEFWVYVNQTRRKRKTDGEAGAFPTTTIVIKGHGDLTQGGAELRVVGD